MEQPTFIARCRSIANRPLGTGVSLYAWNGSPDTEDWEIGIVT